MAEVLFLTRVLTHYRVPFHEAVREQLSRYGVNYRLAHGRPTAAEAKKDDLGVITWAEAANTHYLGSSGLTWQQFRKGKADLIVIGQENKNLNNYALQLRRMLGLSGPKLAYFGHGKNFQADQNSQSERFKRFWSNKVDWWFAYTEKSAQIVASAGFPRERITVFNNAIDTYLIRQQLDSIDASEMATLRKRFGGSNNIGVYIGGLYGYKRIPFLIQAAKAVRALVPDFQLLFIGGGVDAALVEAAAAENDWIHALGPKFGRDKTLLASLGKVFLMPGLVGLGVLDSFAYGTPMVTTDLPYHSPEIDYLEDGANGVIIKEADSIQAYATGVARVLQDVDYRRKLQAGGQASLGTYTVEAMANRFADGIVKALRLNS